MKKALALSAFALVMALPLVSSASSLTSTFLTSSTGSATNLAVSDTIQMEVTATIDSGLIIDTFFWDLTGDVAGALASGPGVSYAGTQNLVTGWAWAFFPGKNNVDMGTNGRIVPFAEPTPPPTAAAGQYGYFATGGKTGDGIPSLLGTVTIHATTAGTYQGGGYFFPGLDTLFGSGVEEPMTISTVGFTVVPEPGTAVLMLLGLGGLGVMGRKSRK